jgi:hypothetical protein
VQVCVIAYLAQLPFKEWISLFGSFDCDINFFFKVFNTQIDSISGESSFTSAEKNLGIV